MILAQKASAWIWVDNGQQEIRHRTNDEHGAGGFVRTALRCGRKTLSNMAPSENLSVPPRQTSYNTGVRAQESLP